LEGHVWLHNPAQLTRMMPRSSADKAERSVVDS
jgi:hypothetical protein